jgi:Predicted metal-binding, possibly nucleic acid-binding protein
MFFDISELTKKNQEKISINSKIPGENFYNNGDFIEFSKPIELVGAISLISNVMELRANLKTEVILPCSRCLERYKYPLDIEVIEDFTQDEIDDDEITRISGSTIDLKKVCEDNILLAIPYRGLCKEECKGLCQRCGTNLNNSSCECEKDDIDPRLEKLKNFFR